MQPRLLFVALLLPLLSACGGAEDLPFSPAGPDAAPDPAELGPYGVGVETIEVVDPSRFDAETRTPRSLAVEVWYPTREVGDGAAYPFTDFLTDDLRNVAQALGALETSAVRDAEPAPGPFPLVVFSHGSGGVRVQSTFLTVYLASHGYVVAAPDHAGNTLKDLIEDGSLDAGRLTQSLVDRPLDVRVVLDEVIARHDVDEAKIGVAGHSFGAVTALRAAGQDRRVGAVVAQTPAGHLLTWVGIDTPMAELGVPIMIQDGVKDETTPPETNARTFVPYMGPPGYYLSLLRAGHFTYSDLCTFELDVVLAAEDIGIGDALSDGCDDDDVPPEVAQPLIRNFSVGLFNRYLRDSPGTQAYLLDEAELAGEATLETWD